MGKHQRFRIILPLTLLGLYLLVFAPLYNLIGRGVSAFISIPVVLLTWWYGFRIGLGACVAGILLNLVLFGVVGADITYSWLASMAGIFTLLMVVAITGYLHDLAQRRQRELEDHQQTTQTLQEERHFTTAILQTAEALIIVLDRQGRIVRFNGACERLTGFREDEIKGQEFWDLVLPPDEVASVKTAFEQLTAGQFPNTHENHWQTKQGNKIWISWSNTVLLDSSGAVKYVIGTGLDTSGRRRAEKQALELAVEREKVRLLADFVRNISHDFRRPLALINTNLYLFQKDTQPEQKQHRLETIQAQSDYLTMLLEDLLTMAELDSIHTLELEPHDVSQVIAELRLLITDQAAQRQQHVQFQFPSSLPRIPLHRAYFTQALREILDNAFRYSHTGDTIYIRIEQQELWIVTEIRDTGTGIASKDLPHLFDHFYKANDARTSDQSGSGLGLSMAKRIIDLHRGKIEVQSQQQVGSNFRIYLPISESADSVAGGNA